MAYPGIPFGRCTSRCEAFLEATAVHKRVDGAGRSIWRKIWLSSARVIDFNSFIVVCDKIDIFKIFFYEWFHEFDHGRCPQSGNYCFLPL